MERYVPTRSRQVLKPELIALTLALITPAAFAAPDSGNISVGTGSIIQSGATTTITQNTQNLAINWQSFSIGATEAVHFEQPNASAIALNRVLGQDPSQIFGSLTANGQVFILNPNGVLFGSTAQVSVGGLVASPLNISDDDFIAGNYRFETTLAGEGQGRGSVVNQGSLTAVEGGYIALLAPEARNEGVITATLGTALLAAGDKVTLNLDNGSLLGFSIDQGALDALAENSQLIQADGGKVILSAMAADALSSAVVNNSGIIEAHTVQNTGGVIRLLGDMQSGTVINSGTLDASAPSGGDGGVVETSAASIVATGNATVITDAPFGQSGVWIIDSGFTVTGGSFYDAGGISGGELGTGGAVISGEPVTVSGGVYVGNLSGYSISTSGLTGSDAGNAGAPPIHSVAISSYSGAVGSSAAPMPVSVGVPVGAISASLPKLGSSPVTFGNGGINIPDGMITLGNGGS